MKIAMGCDHGGIHLKEHIKKYLIGKGIEVVDHGTYTEDSCDYPDYAAKVCKDITSGASGADRGILICGTGIGISIAANKVPGIRCALCHDCFSAKATREHNNANVLVMPGRFIDTDMARKILDEFFATEFEGGRHQERIEAIPVSAK